MTSKELLNRIDAPLFTRQREALTRVIDCEGYRPDAVDLALLVDLELLEGLRNLCDQIADYLEDQNDPQT